MSTTTNFAPGIFRPFSKVEVYYKDNDLNRDMGREYENCYVYNSEDTDLVKFECENYVEYVNKRLVVKIVCTK